MGKSLGEHFWQRNYYEQVIRTGEEVNEVSRHVWENPVLWEFDEENPKCRRARKNHP